MANAFRKSLRRFAVVLMFAGAGVVGDAAAALFDRGNGLVYDDVEDILWTQVADLSGLHPFTDASGVLTPASHQGWIGGFELAGFSDFRLATISELVSLYGRLPGGPNSDKSGDIGPFSHVQNMYASSNVIFNSSFGTFLNPKMIFGGGAAPGCLPTEECFDPNVQVPFVNGSQFLEDINHPGQLTYAWAVRDGDVVNVSPIPEPETYGMLLAGLALLTFTTRRHQKKAAVAKR